MYIALGVYILLILVFLLGFGIIYRHQSAYGYLSPRFRKVITVAAVFSVVLIAASLFFAYLLFRQNGPTVPTRSATPVSDIQF